MKHILLLEEVGINREVVILSDYVIDQIIKSGKEPRDFTFQKDELEGVTNLPINKLTVTYNPIKKGEKLMSVGGKEDVRGFFNVSHSKRFKSGNTEILLTLTDLKKTLVYHEINHALQFIKLGKSQSIGNYSLNTYADTISKTFEDKFIKGFAQLLYFCAETEINSKVIEFFALVRGLMKVELKKFVLPKDYNLKSLEDRLEILKKDYFRESLKVREPYIVAKFCQNYDINKYFEKCDDYDKKLYFGLLSNILDLQKVGNKIKEEDFPKYGFLLKTLGNKIPDGQYDPPLLSDEELRRDMKFYQSYINNQGKKLKKKLLKTWSMIEREVTVEDLLKNKKD